VKRSIALLTSLAALAFASATIASASTEAVDFALTPDRDSAKIHASFHDGTKPEKHDNWSTGFMPSELIGLEVSSFHAAGAKPIRFAIAREAGRLDCAGTGGNGSGRGTCRFTPDEDFAQMLASRGVGRPDHSKAFALVAVDAHRELVDALSVARYPMPSLNDFIALSALRVDRPYIAGLASAGYRPASVQSLIEFKALGITPSWIGGLVRVGYANVPGDELVQLRTLGVTPEFISGYQALGYRNLPVSRLVELKAMSVTPEFVRSVVRSGEPLPPLDDLMKWTMFGRPR
jgi:hypothetical protein